MNKKLSLLVELSREIGREDRQLAILGEGNTSVKLGANRFAVKASGCSLATLTKADVAICHADNILALLNRKNPGDEAIDKTLFDARVNGAGKKPSVEAMFHAWLLTLPGINFVGHCHPQTVNQVLCSPRAREFAERRSCPDEVVCCGPASVFVPYADPGLALALEIRKRTVAFIRQSGFTPRLIVLQNHGIIALGGTPQAVLACLLMAAKAAAIFVGAAQLGGPNFMVAKEVRRIFSRGDEAYRQRQLKI